MKTTYQDGVFEGYRKALQDVSHACSKCIDETRQTDGPLAFSHRFLVKLQELSADVLAQELSQSSEAVK